MLRCSVQFWGTDLTPRIKLKALELLATRGGKDRTQLVYLARPNGFKKIGTYESAAWKIGAHI